MAPFGLYPRGCPRVTLLETFVLTVLLSAGKACGPAGRVLWAPRGSDPVTGSHWPCPPTGPPGWHWGWSTGLDARAHGCNPECSRSVHSCTPCGPSECLPQVETDSVRHPAYTRVPSSWCKSDAKRSGTSKSCSYPSVYAYCWCRRGHARTPIGFWPLG